MIKAFTWVGNTGKSTTIEKLDGVKYWEIAREHFDKLDNIKEFQKAILEDEKKRLFELLTYTDRIDVIVDRTFVDNLIYLYYSIITGNIEDEFDFGELSSFIEKSVELYDEVILFTEPLKENTQFKQYNDPTLNELFITTIKKVYWDKVKQYKNSKEYLSVNIMDS